MGLELGKRGELILEKAEGSAEARSCKALVGRGKEFGLYSKFSNKPLISLQQGSTRIWSGIKKITVSAGWHWTSSSMQAGRPVCEAFASIGEMRDEGGLDQLVVTGLERSKEFRVCFGD